MGADAASEPPREAGTAPRLGLLIMEILVLVNILMVSTAHHFWVTAPPTAPIFADGAGHMQRAAAQYSMITSGLTRQEKAFGLAAWPRTYPPLVFDVSAMWSVVFGPGPSQALRALGVFLVFLGVGAWLIGRAAGGPLIGLATACAALADNSMLNAKLFYYLDMPMTAFLVLAIGLMAYSDRGSRRWPTLGVGITLGVGFLCKFTMVFFLAVPLVLWSVQTLLACDDRRRAAWRFVLLISVTGAIFGLLASRNSAQASVTAYETPLDDRLIMYWFAWCGLALALAQRALVPRARSCAQAFLLSGVIVGPWFLSNAPALMHRSSEIGLPGAGALEKLQRSVWPFVDPGLVVLCLVGFVAAFLVPSKRRPLVPLALTLGCAFYLNLRVLNCTMQSYYVPVAVLMSVLAVAWIPRRLGPLALLVLGGLFCARLLGPMYFAEEIRHSQRPWLSKLVNFGRGIHSGGGPGFYSLESAQEVLDRLPGSTRTLAIASVTGGNERLTNALVIIDMVSSWRGATIFVARAQIGTGGVGFSSADGDTVRYAMFARVAGQPAPDLWNHPPDAILVPPDGGLTPEHVLAVWGQGYSRVDTQSGPLLLRGAAPGTQEHNER